TRGKALAKDAEADDQVGDDQFGSAFLDARRETPRQKLRIALDIRDERKELLRRVGQHTLLGMRRHRGLQPRVASLAVRAARNRAKSSPAWYEERVKGEAETNRKPLPKAKLR